METIKVTHVHGHAFGGSFLGTLLIALCFGVLTIQTSSYYHAFPNDGRRVKLTVALLWTLEGLQLAFSTQSLYWRFVGRYHNPLTLKSASWESAIYPLNVACLSFIVQTFFAYRLYSLSANLYVGMLVQVLVLLQFGFSAANTIKSITMLGSRVRVKETPWLIEAWLTTQAITDIVIAAFMCLLLRRRRTGFQKTDSVLKHMVLYTISTGLVTSVLSCICLALFAKYRYRPYSIGVLVISIPLGGVYSISMLTNLHMRTRLRARLDTQSPLELTAYLITKRIGENVGDPGNEERFQATRNVTGEVARNDVDIDPMNRDTKDRFAAGVKDTAAGAPSARHLPLPNRRSLEWQP